MKFFFQAGSFLALISCACTLSTVNADEPTFGFLEEAQWLEDQERFLETENPIRLVQAENATEETRQPTDFGQVRTTSAEDVSSARNFDFSRLAPELASITPALNTPEQVTQLQQATQRVETGIGQTAPLEIIPGSTFNLVAVPDAVETLSSVANVTTVDARRRNPMGFDPRIRGYNDGQIYQMQDGSYQMPVRSDLDTSLTKYDQSLIASTEVISGPYGLRYGSAFAFLNVSTIPTPRYEGGRENHVRLGTNIRANGGQTYNTASILGGSRRYGYFANVAYRKGSDYNAGNGLAIPSSYDALNLFSGIGWDVTDYTRMETKFNYLKQGATEYAGQFFDVNQLDSYGITHSIIHSADRGGIGSRTDLWVNHTEFDGDTLSSGKRRADFPVLQRVDQAIFDRDGQVPPTPVQQFTGTVGGNLTTAGARTGATQDMGGGDSVGAGADFRYVQQTIGENYTIPTYGSPSTLNFGTGMPTSQIFDPGLYAESSIGLTDYWRTAIGARLAFASTQADPNDVRFPNSNFRGLDGKINKDLTSSDILGSFYVTNDIDLSEQTQSRVGLGYAERLPNLTDRYSDGVFLGVIQSGFSRVIGDPSLDKERNLQMDIRFDSEFGRARTRVSAFNSWIMDYVTYKANVVGDPTGARLLQTVNTSYATLAGFEAYGEADVRDGIQAFTSLTYLDGRDRQINQPLAGISPLQNRIGLRLTDPSPAKKFGVESGWRIVNQQERLGTLRAVLPNQPIVTLETRTPGFATSYIRGYYKPTNRVNMTGGIENLFNRNYYEHLSLRLPPSASGQFGQTFVYSPGFTPYLGIEVDY